MKFSFDSTINLEAILAVIGMGTGVILWLVGRRKSKRTEAENAKMAEILAKIKREAEAPYLVPSDTRVNLVFDEGEPGHVGFYSWANGNLLCTGREEVSESMPAGKEVIFLIENTGKPARACVIELDGKEIALRREPKMKDAHGLQFLAYPFDPSLRGKPQKLSLTFKTHTGFQDTHIYMTRHGCRVLVRIEPPLLEKKSK